MKCYTTETAVMALDIHKQILHHSLWKPKMTMAASVSYELPVLATANSTDLDSNSSGGVYIGVNILLIPQ